MYVSKLTCSSSSNSVEQVTKRGLSQYDLHKKTGLKLKVCKFQNTAFLSAELLSSKSQPPLCSKCPHHFMTIWPNKQLQIFPPSEAVSLTKCDVGLNQFLCLIVCHSGNNQFLYWFGDKAIAKYVS